jgi:hypothetical protein
VQVQELEQEQVQAGAGARSGAGASAGAGAGVGGWMLGAGAVIGSFATSVFRIILSRTKSWKLYGRVIQYCLQHKQNTLLQEIE